MTVVLAPELAEHGMLAHEDVRQPLRPIGIEDHPALCVPPPIPTPLLGAGSGVVRRESNEQGEVTQVLFFVRRDGFVHVLSVNRSFRNGHFQTRHFELTPQKIDIVA
jgi:hypothetical protein